jgi:hypothetical protein
VSIFGFAALVAVYLMTAELQITGAWRAAAFMGALGSPHILSILSHANVYTIVLLLLVMTWLAWRRHAEMIGGTLIGLGLAFKTAGLFLLPLMVFEQRWRALMGVVGTVLLLVLVTFPFVGARGWTAYLAYAWALAGNPALSLGHYQSVTGLSRNFFQYDAHYHPNPYVDAPAFASRLGSLPRDICRSGATRYDREGP